MLPGSVQKGSEDTSTDGSAGVSFTERKGNFMPTDHTGSWIEELQGR